jgi:hypothetical protein
VGKYNHDKTVPKDADEFGRLAHQPESFLKDIDSFNLTGKGDPEFALRFVANLSS